MRSISAGFLPWILIGCLACAGDAESPRDVAPEETPDAAALVERALEALSSEPRTFSVVERRGDEVVRQGELQVATTAPERPTFRLSLDDEPPVELASDGETLYVARPSGDVVTSGWDSAATALFPREAGKVLPTVLNPSSFTEYGGEVSAGDDGASWVMRTGLPNGGGWELTLDADSGLPRSLSLRSDADAAPEVIEIAPTPATPPVDPARYRLAPSGEGRLSEFFAGPAPGDPAPPVSFELADGTELSLDELRGSPVVLDFWATWCVPCRPAMRELETLHQANAGEGLKVFGLRLWDSGDAQAFLEDVGATYPMGKGDPFVEPYAIDTYGLPTLYVVDADGTIVDVVVGFKAGITEEKIQTAVARALGRV